MDTLKRLIVLLAILGVSIGVKGQDRSEGTNDKSRIDIALIFINDYLTFCQNKESESKTTEWIQGNKLLTNEFKATYTDLIQKARKEEPEIGLDFDPILNAQDYPEKGFEFGKSDNREYVTVRGIDWPTFTTVIRLKLVGDKWLVDGAGIINIPKDKQ